MHYDADWKVCLAKFQKAHQRGKTAIPLGTFGATRTSQACMKVPGTAANGYNYALSSQVTL